MIRRKVDGIDWAVETLTPSDLYYHEIRQVIVHKKTIYQEMLILDCGFYGKALVLDGYWQSTTGDEFLYHEPLVHPACLQHGDPKRVLILGGGEGAAVREVLKWHGVEQVTMVDIDGEVVEACREHLSEMHQGAFTDPRTQVIIADARDCLDAEPHQWDIIISDLADPVEDGPAYYLFTQEYFEKCRRALTPGGYLVVQAGACDPASLTLHAQLFHTLQSVFPNVTTYSSYVPTYGSLWGFILASANTINTRPEPATIDQILAEKTSGHFRMFDGITLLGLLQPPKHIRDAIAQETKVYTLNAPPGLPSGRQPM